MTSNTQTDNKAGKKSSALQVVFLLDITGSMSSQIAATKQMITSFLSSEREGVQVHVWTFTESSSRCFVDKSPITSPQDLQTWVGQIQLAKSRCGSSASGGDGPENVVAAFASLLDDFTDENILCFIITDDSPHHKAFGNGGEARAEISFLQSKGFTEVDVFSLLNQVIESLNITVVPVLYGASSSCLWYQQAAVLTQGIVLCPESSDANLLAKGLVSIMDAMQQMAASRQVNESVMRAMGEGCRGFSMLQIKEEEFTPLDKDPSAANEIRVQRPVSKEGIQAALVGLVHTTFDRFAGKRGGKRCRTVNPQVISTSVRVFLFSLLELTKSKLANSKKLQEAVTELLDIFKKADPSDQDASRQQTLLCKWIEDMKSFSIPSSTLSDTSLQPVSCVVTLESALDYISSLEQVPSTDKDVSEWMEIVLQLTMCRLVNVVFPRDATGNTDFADAWSANVNNISLASVMSASSAVKLRNIETGIYVDPMTRADYSTAVIMAHPNDSVLTACYAALSSLSSLQGLVQGYLASGGLKIFPSLVPGLQSSSLINLFRSISRQKPEFKQSEWETVRCLIWSLRQARGTPASEVVKSLRANEGLNPADNFSKLYAGIVVYLDRCKSPDAFNQQLMTMIFEEISADYIAFLNRRLIKEAEKAEKIETSKTAEDANVSKIELPSALEIAKCFVSDSTDNFDPIKSLHQAEQISNNTQPLSDDGMKRIGDLVNGLNGFHDICVRYKQMCRTLVADLSQSDVSKAFCSAEKLALPSDEELKKIFTDSLFYKKRTLRYNLNEVTKQWSRRLVTEMPNLDDLARQNISQAFADQFAGWKAKRATFARNHLLESVVNLSGKTVDEFDEQLSKLKFDLLGNTYKLGRMDVPDLLASLSQKAKSKLSTLGVALAIGKWTTQPPSQLRRYTVSICEYYADNLEVQSKLKTELSAQEICNRETPNRHGHHRGNIFPGLLGWTQSYHDERMKYISGKPHVVASLEAIKEYTLFSQHVRAEMKVGNNRTKLIEMVLDYPKDPVHSKVTRKLIEPILKRSTLDQSTFDAEITDIIKKTTTSKRKKGNNPLRHLNSLIDRVEADAL